MTEILVDGLELHTFHGITDEERSVGQTLRIDATLIVQEAASETDSIQDTVDYASLCDVLSNLATERSFRTLERLANVMADAVLDRFLLAQSLEIELRKIKPDVPHTVEALGVRIRADRRT